MVTLEGPTCVGKGFTVKQIMRTLQGLIQKLGLRVKIISFGKMIRDLLEKDQGFYELHGPTVLGGDLLPDNVAIELFTKAHRRIRRSKKSDIIIIDGFFRTIGQIVWGQENGFIQAGDIVYSLGANEETCLKRLAHRNEKSREKRQDGDIAKFEKRFNDHSKTVGELRRRFKKLGVKTHIIDANQDIAEHIATTILSDLLPEIFKILKT